MSELKQFNSNLKKTIKLDEMKEESKEVVNKVKEDYVEEKGKKDDFEIYMKSSNRLSSFNDFFKIDVVSFFLFIKNLKSFFCKVLIE